MNTFRITSLGRGTWIMGLLVLLPALLAPSGSFMQRLVWKLHLETVLTPFFNFYPSLGGILAQAWNLRQLAQNNYSLIEQYYVGLTVSCLGIVVLLLCLMFFWQQGVERTVFPGWQRVLVTLLQAVGCSLLLTALLGVIEWMVVLRVYPYNYTVLGVLIVDGYLMLAEIFGLPLLFLVGLLVTRRKVQTPPMPA